MQVNDRTVPAVRVQNGHSAGMHNFLSCGLNFAFAAAFDVAYISCWFFKLEQHPEVSVGIRASQRYMELKLQGK